MISVLEALFPIFALIGFGAVLKRREWVPESFWDSVERLVYYLLFPALLIHRMAGTDMAGLDVWPIFGAVCGTLLVLAGLVLSLRRFLPIDGPAFTSVFQGSIRFNTYVALAVPTALFGEVGTLIATLCVAAAIPLINVLCVTVLVAHGSGSHAPGIRSTLLSLIRNPLIVAILVGISMNVTGIGLPPFIGPFLEILGRASLPMALLAIGAGLDIAAARAAGPMVGLAAAVKLGLKPLLVWAIGSILGLKGLTLAICVTFAAMPVAPSAYILARAMGGDERLIAGIITATTLIAMVTLPLTILLVL